MPVTIERWTKGCILLFPKDGDLGIVKNFRGIILISMVAKVYNALLLNCIEPEIEKILTKNQNGFWRTRSTISQILTIHRIIGVCAIKPVVTLLFIDFSKVFDSIHREKIEQILVAYGLPQKTVTAIRMLYSNTKVKFRSTRWRHRLLWHCC